MDPPLDDINNEFPYSPEGLEFINSIELEAADLFPEGKQYANAVALREEVREFAHKKGFAVTTDGCKLCCTRFDEPHFQKAKRDRKVTSGIVPVEKQRTYRSSTHCGCPFKVTSALVQIKDKSNQSIKLTAYSNFKHGNGCIPSRSQLVVEKRKAGTYTRVINEYQIKTIRTLIQTKKETWAGIMRDLVRPLFPPGHSLDSKLLLNFRLKAKRILASNVADISSMTVTRDDETMLLATDNMDAQSPTYFSEVFQKFNEMLKEALLDKNDLDQIETYLNSLGERDSSFKYRRATAKDGSVTDRSHEEGFRTLRLIP